MTNQWFGFAVIVPQTSHLNSVSDAIETISPFELIRAWRVQTTRSFYTGSKSAGVRFSAAWIAPGASLLGNFDVDIAAGLRRVDRYSVECRNITVCGLTHGEIPARVLLVLALGPGAIAEELRDARVCNSGWSAGPRDERQHIARLGSGST